MPEKDENNVNKKPDPVVEQRPKSIIESKIVVSTSGVTVTELKLSTDAKAALNVGKGKLDC